MQSAHNLTQALQSALHLSLTTVVKDASFHLLECIGNLDAHSCVQLLALYQVNVMSQNLLLVSKRFYSWQMQ